MNHMMVRAYQHPSLQRIWGVAVDGARVVTLSAQAGERVETQVRGGSRKDAEALEQGKLKAGYEFIGERWLEDGMLRDESPQSRSGAFSPLTPKLVVTWAKEQSPLDVFDGLRWFDVDGAIVRSPAAPQFRLDFNPGFANGVATIADDGAVALLASYLLVRQGITVTDASDQALTTDGLATVLIERIGEIPREALEEAGVIRKPLTAAFKRKELIFELPPARSGP